MRPHLADAVLDPSGRVVKTLAHRPARRLKLTGLQAIRDGLYSATHSAGGTSTSVFGGFPVDVSGKTGTAEAPPGSDHSWYASWAPSRNPRYVVVVLIEHGGFGAQAAAPAAKEIYSALFNVPGSSRITVEEARATSLPAAFVTSHSVSASVLPALTTRPSARIASPGQAGRR